MTTGPHARIVDGVGAAGGERRALVINDDPLQLKLTSRVLERIGLTVLDFAAAEDAVAYLTGGGPADLIVTDIHMPGVDGWRLCRLLRSPDLPECNEIPILVISATFSGVDAEEVTADLGANAFLPVPYEPATLERYVLDLLAGERPRPPQSVVVVGVDSHYSVPLADCFRAYGYMVAEEPSAGACRDSLRRNPAGTVILQGDAPDPQAETLLADLRGPASTSVVAVVSAHHSPQEALRWLKLGADAYVPYPLDPEYLLEVCEKARRERSLLRVQELLEERTYRLKASDERFRRLFESIPDLVFLLDPEGHIQLVNQMGGELLGAAPDHLVGRPLADLVEESRRPELRQRLRDAGERGTFETTLQTLHGPVPVEVHHRAMGLEGRAARLAIARDVTERRRAEENARDLEAQLIQSQKLEALGTLAGGIAHDFNNVLSGILGCANLLKLRADDPEKVARAADIIEGAVRRAADLTQQLLGFARRGKNQNVPVPVNQTVRDAVALLSRTLDRSIRLESDLDPADPIVTGDPGQLQQILLNLALNARDALEEQPGGLTGGVIRFATRNLEIGNGGDPVSTLSPGPYVEFSVSDTGPGVPESIRSRIFEPFFTTKEPGRGTGMGLAMVYGIARNHGGVVLLERARDLGGACFQVLLPRSEQRPEARPPEQPPPMRLRRGRGRVLVVDDEPIVRGVAVRMLRELGYQAEAVDSGEAALERYRGNGGDIDLVLLDLVMPGMGGADTYRRLRDLNPDVKAILVTGYSMNESVQKLLDEGILEFLPKPYHLQEISEVLARYLPSSEENGSP